MAISWSRNGNPIITTTAYGVTEDLLGHAEKIGKIFTKNTLILALLDTDYYQARVNMLSMKDTEGNICNSREIHEELMEYIMDYNKLCHTSPVLARKSRISIS